MMSSSTKISLSMMAVAGAQARVHSHHLRRELEDSLSMPLSFNTMPAKNGINTDNKKDEDGSAEILNHKTIHQDQTPDSGIINLVGGLIMNINNNNKSLNANVENVMNAVGILPDDSDSVREVVEAIGENWQALPRDSKCKVLQNIFTLPPFGKKLDKWLELACPGNSKSAKSSKSKTSKSSSNDDDAPTINTTVLSTFDIPLDSSSIKESEAVRKLLKSTTGRKLQDSNAGLSDEAVAAYLATIQQIVEGNVPTGTTVISVTLISITEVNGVLKFVTQTILDVVCTPPCDESQAKSDALDQVNSSLDTSLSDGSFSAALTGNLAGVTSCGTAFPTCNDLATANTEVTVQVHMFVFVSSVLYLYT